MPTADAPEAVPKPAEAGTGTGTDATTTTAPTPPPTMKPAVFKPGVVLGKDGKPCRTCTSFRSWAAATAKAASTRPSQTTPTTSPTPTPSPAAQGPPPDCPPDVETLGRSTWTFLHTLAASYPSTAGVPRQSEMAQFMGIFARIYPCWVCAEDFERWMGRRENRLEIDVSGGDRDRDDDENEREKRELERGRRRGHLAGRKEFGLWMCNAHNHVNRKLGKVEFDCSKWEERWKTGWKDGRCD
ncbi:Flavin-linked sulfhydryl oxidase of the mitochondrial IMS [Rhizina undulata]